MNADVDISESGKSYARVKIISWTETARASSFKKVVKPKKVVGGTVNDIAH